MPVYGLPFSLEASLNSLAELRPPTSWRVSGHGNDVTVVLRWALCGSPSSEKTLEYETNDHPRSVADHSRSHLWSRKHKLAVPHHSPKDEIKTRCSSTSNSKVVHPSPIIESGFHPLKIRKIETFLNHSKSSPPVPIYITTTENAFTPPPSMNSEEQAKTPSASASFTNACVSNHSCEEVDVTYSYEGPSCEDSNAQHAEEDISIQYATPNSSPGRSTDDEIRSGIRAYLAQCVNEAEPDEATTTLDEATGLFITCDTVDDDTASSQTNEERRQTAACQPRTASQLQRDARSLSDSSSTSSSRSRHSSMESSSDQSSDSLDISQDTFDHSGSRNVPSSSASAKSGKSPSLFGRLSRSRRTRTRSLESCSSASTVPARVGDGEQKQSRERSPSKNVSEVHSRESSPLSDLDVVHIREGSPSNDRDEVNGREGSPSVDLNEDQVREGSPSNELDLICSDDTEAELRALSISSSSSSSRSPSSFWDSFERLKNKQGTDLPEGGTEGEGEKEKEGENVGGHEGGHEMKAKNKEGAREDTKCSGRSSHSL